MLNTLAKNCESAYFWTIEAYYWISYSADINDIFLLYKNITPSANLSHKLFVTSLLCYPKQMVCPETCLCNANTNGEVLMVQTGPFKERWTFKGSKWWRMPVR